MASNSSQRLAKERQASQGSFSTSSLSSSASSLSKSANGPVQQSNRSKATSKRPVTPNSRAPSTIDSEPVLKVPTKRSVTPISRTNSIIYNDPEPGRVRVSVRLRPINDDLASDADYADCVELQPEMKKLKLRKSNWNSESYKFDEVFTATATQKRVYQVAAKPVVESVLSGFNGTIMAYGQTGTGKTYTVGNLGKDDASERGIMVRALEDIIANTSPAHDTVEVSYLQLYVDSVQDLLSPDKINIPIVEERKTGEVLLPGSTVVKIRDLDHFMELLQKGEAHRHAANTKMNTNSSRSHAILMVYVRRSVPGRLDTSVYSHEKVRGTDFLGSTGIGTFQRSKLLIVDLAGSERIGKSGSEGQLLEEAKFINLSLTSLGKCINALAENSCHIPTRESKLTRLLRDSFGGSARTSLIITIGPSASHHAETFSTIMFGQRAMKIVNMVKLKEEFDYERSYRKLEIQVDHLTREIDRQQKFRDNYINEMEKKLKECQLSFAEAEKSLVTRSEILEKENARLEMEMKDTLAELNHEKDFNKWLHDEVARLEMCLEHCKQEQHENSTYQSAVADTTEMYEKQIAELIEQLEYEQARFEDAEGQLDAMKKLLSDHEMSIKQHQLENLRFQNLFSDTTQAYEKKIEELTKHLEDEHAHRELAEARVGSLEKLLSDQNSIQSKDQIDNSELREKLEELDHKRQSEVTELQTKLEKVNRSHEMAINELLSFKVQNTDLLSEKDKIRSELETALNKLLDEEKQRMILENELIRIRKVVLENNEDFEDKKLHMSRGSSSFRTTMSLHGSLSGQRSTISNFCEEVGLEKILSLLSSEDTDLQMQAIKVVANLAAEDNNQEKIVNGGGLDALLMLLRSSQSITILRVASGAIANLAMKETNQSLIMSKGGAELLASTASKTDDPQTFRMVAGAIANLCGNVNLHLMLEQEECIKALIGMARYGNPDVVAQVARGLANFAKCETREVTLGNQKGRSLLMEDGALAWLIDNANTTSASARRHIELALCHLAQNEDNTRDFISTGGLKEVIRIASESTNEDIRNLAKRTLKMNPTFQAQLCTKR